MKVRSRFVCADCGFAVPKWMGQCPECGVWNRFEEQRVHRSGGANRRSVRGLPTVKTLGEIEEGSLPRYRTAVEEFDRVLGGGLVPGSVVLVAGDPGVGKSTLLLQAASAYAGTGLQVLYVTAEESERQLRLRSRRIEAIDDSIRILATNQLADVEAVLEAGEPDVLIVDSVQTLNRDGAAQPPGTVGQVRDTTLFFMERAKRTQVPVLLVGHVTKDGQVAGPKVVEHMVDAVLYLEGDRTHRYRVLRAAKNRFGPTHEMGLFEMRDSGMLAVENPSALLLEERHEGPGSAVAVAMEGTRPFLLEVQALVGPPGAGTPRRVATGPDPKRLAVVLAVLERRASLPLAANDVFVNVAGGLRVYEPGLDLALALALASSAFDRALDPRLAAVGELGLGGELRRVSQIARRVTEAERLGFERVLVPERARDELVGANIELVAVARLDEALDACFPVGDRGPVLVSPVGDLP